MTVNLDLKDRKLLYELDKNCRQSNSQIAKKIGLSKDSVGYRINRLEKKEILSGYRTIINVRKLGYVQFRTLWKFIDINSEKMKELMSFLNQKKNVWILGKNEGEWDFAFVYSCKRSIKFYEFLDEFYKNFRTIIKEQLIAELFNYHEIERSYLVSKKLKNYKKPTLESTKFDVDKTDLKILNELSKNARVKLIDLATKLKESSMLIHQRIKKLEKKEIIIAYKADMHVINLGRDYYGVKLNLSNYSEKEKIMQEVASLPETTAIIYAIGSYDIEFDLELTGTVEYHKIINNLRNKFSSIRDIKSIRAVEYYIKEHKFE